MKKIIFFIIFLLLLSCEKKENIDNVGNLNNNNGNIKKIGNKKSVEEQIKEMVNIWNEASSNADFDTLERILGDRIDYYQSIVSKSYYIADQKRFFQKNPVYSQRIIGEIIVTQLSNGQLQAEFVKEVSTSRDVKNYPSYLVFENINGEWKLVVESDTVSDANIARMRNGKRNVQRKVQNRQPAATIPNQTEYDYNSSVTIVGTLISRKYQTINNSETDVFFLRLSTPITVIGNSSEDSPTETNVQEIQLMGNETLSLFDRNVLGKRVQVTGELFHSHTAHHHTEVLIMTSNINFLN